MMKLNRQNAIRFLFGSLALTCFVLLFVGGPGPHASRTFVYGWGLGHLFSFALWTYLYLNWQSRQGLLRQVGEVLLLALLVGAATELLQSGFGREATWKDLGNDLLGSLLCLVFSSTVRLQISGIRLWAARLVVMVAVGWSVVPFAKVTVDEFLAKQQFPLLSGFETSLELGRWGGDCRRRLDRQHVYSGSQALRVELTTRRYSGVSLKYFPADWRTFRSLRFYLYNPQSEPFQFYFRIHDRQHKANGSPYSDRYNTSYEVPAGWTEMEVPLDAVVAAPKERSLNLAEIDGLILFVDKLEQPRTIYLDEVMLIR